MTMSSDEHGRTSLTKSIAGALFAVTVLEVVIAIVGAALTGSTLDEALNSYLVTNSAIGLSCAASGVLIAWHRPRNPVGWLLAAAGALYAMSAAVSPAFNLAFSRGWSVDSLRTVMTVYFFAWPWAITLCLPLALLLFPTGRMPSPRWRWLLWVGVVGGTVAAIGQVTAPSGFGINPWIALPNHDQLSWLWQLAEWVVDAIYLVSLVALVVRYRRGDEKLRRQLLWLVLSLTIAIVVQAVWGPLVDGLAVLNLLSIALVPISMTIAVLRYQLLDIRLVLSRTVLYLVLSALVLGVYLGLVAVAGLVLADPGRGTAAVITLLIAVGFNPVRVRLQRLVDRALYGDRVDPVRVVSRIGEQLAGGDERDVLRAVADALRLPYAAVLVDGVEWAAYGTAPVVTESIALEYRGLTVGRLVIGVRAGEAALARADRTALELLAAPLAVAARATRLSEELQRSREEIVSSREEERRRLRRDLHDGLGTALTGIAFQADAARNLVRSDPVRAEELLASLRNGAGEAIGDVRRLVYALRPPSLDELGLVGAIRRLVDRLDSGATSVTLSAPDTLPELPAAVEVAAYRIVLEALTNATRHARARTIEVTVRAVDDELEITVDDDGDATASWQPGVGMVAMRERTAELGGSLFAGPQATGGRVRACLPIAGSNRPRGGSPDGAKLVAGEPESAASSALQVTG
jgi:signal transduction histidine kinase